jgi:anti-sigma regulatory factor (Ser/Thr protein kinase)
MTATIRLKNRIEELRILERSLREYFEEHGLPDNERDNVNLVLEELVSNAITHGYPDDSEHEIVIRLNLSGDDLQMEVEDDGRAFDPLKVPAPTIAPTLEEQQVGGMGLLLVRSLTSELSYERAGDRNRLTLIKRSIRS